MTILLSVILCITSVVLIVLGSLHLVVSLFGSPDESGDGSRPQETQSMPKGDEQTVPKADRSTTDDLTVPGPTSIDRMTENLLPPQPSRALVRRELGYFLRRLGLTALFLPALLLVGALSFSRFEGTTYWQGIMRAFETITTVGSIGHPRTRK